jgi:hypothetical protein
MCTLPYFTTPKTPGYPHWNPYSEEDEGITEDFQEFQDYDEF